MYKTIIRPVLFWFDPEKVHHFTFSFLKTIHKIPGVSQLISKYYTVNHPCLQRQIMGLTFKNPVGLAAGFDKDAQLYNELSCFGFGFVEIGTLTPLPQDGNPKKRLFRLKKDTAIINRMGFNNQGVAQAIQHLKQKHHTIVGGNIGKNKVTPNETATNDYVTLFQQLYPYVDYFTVNVSSPNTPNLRALQDKEPLTHLLQTLQNLNAQQPTVKPIFLKIAPDLTNEQLNDIITIIADTKITGVIATNTTLSRDGLQSEHQDEAGGLSGKPLHNRSVAVVKYLSEKSNKSFPIIGVGGIHSAHDALEMIQAGASLVQLYTGFIYQGPQLVKDINKALIAQA